MSVRLPPKARAKLANRVMRGGFKLATRRVVDPFHRLFYDTGPVTWSDTRWLSVPVQKCPFDLWIYQEIITELRPAVIVETGTAFGGSALFMATVCDAIDHGEPLPVAGPTTGLRRGG